jgi:outer membrane protein OmpA-like peptidoglycan-associated protein
VKALSAPRPLAALTLLTGGALLACGPSPTEVKLAQTEERERLIQLKYQEKTQALIDKSEQLKGVTDQLSEQQWRLRAVCADHADHSACAPFTDLSKAQEAFCKDPFFVKHVDLVISSCHQGQCKQVDSAQEINRAQYMLLTQSLPHTLITFKASDTRLDTSDQQQVQGFLELLDASKGYVIIVGRASKDGDWRTNVRLAIDRAESARAFIVEKMGFDAKRVGYITYGDEKMYLTELDAQRLSGGKKALDEKQANRSALIFSYPCFAQK